MKSKIINSKGAQSVIKAWKNKFLCFKIHDIVEEKREGWIQFLIFRTNMDFQGIDDVVKN